MEDVESYVKGLSGLKAIKWADPQDESPPASIFTRENLKVLIPLEGLIDAEKESERLIKKIAKISKEKDMLASKLSNKKFTENAPKELVSSQKERLSVLATELDNLIAQISELNKLI